MGKYGSVSSAIARIKWGMAKTKKLRGGVEKLIFSVEQGPRADLTPYDLPLFQIWFERFSDREGENKSFIRYSFVSTITNIPDTRHIG